MYFRFVIVCHIHFPDRFFRGLFVPCFFSLTFPSAITIQFSRPFSSCALQLHMSHFVCVVLFAYFELQPHSHTKTTTKPTDCNTRHYLVSKFIGIHGNIMALIAWCRLYSAYLLEHTFGVHTYVYI